MRTLTRIMIPCLIAGLLAIRSGLPQTVVDTAGNGKPGFSGDNGPATSAQIDTAYGVAVDGLGNTYVADSRNHRVRRISDGVWSGNWICLNLRVDLPRLRSAGDNEAKRCQDSSIPSDSF